MKRVDKLTEAQKARCEEWADRWIEIGLRTGDSDRKKFAAAVCECYRFAGLESPKVIVWTTSPLAVSLAGPIAALLIEIAKRTMVASRKNLRGAVRDAVGGAVGGAVRDAVRDAVSGAVDGAVRDAVRDAVSGAVDGAVRGAVSGAVSGALDGAVRDAVSDAVDGAVRDAVSDAVDGAVDGAVSGAVDGAVRDAVSGAVSGAVRGALGGAVDGALDGAVRDAVRGALDGAVSGAVRGAVRDAVSGAVGGALDGAVGDAVRGALDGAVGDAVRDAVSDAVSGAVRGAVRDAVSGAVSGAVGGALDDAVRQVLKRLWSSIFGGQFWVSGYWWGGAWTSFFREVCKLELNGDLWDRGRAYEATMESACWWFAHRDFVIVSERPSQIHRELVDETKPRGFGSHRLHSETEAAASFRDGWGVWSWHGTRVTRQIIEEPETITVKQIAAEQNAEVRRVMVERMGWDRFCEQANMKIIHADELHSNFPAIPVSDVIEPGVRLITTYRAGTETAELLEAADLKDFEDRPLRFVRLTDPSTDRKYTIRVRHNHKRCYEAVAWTFGLTEKEYKSGKYLRQGDVFLKPLSGGPEQQAHS